MAAIRSKNHKLIELLINKVSDFDVKDINFNNVFHVACNQNNAEVVNLLFGSKILTECSKNTSIDANIEKIDLLNQKNKHNATPLEIAIKRNNIEIVKRLLAAGANPDVLNSKGKHLLEQAIFIGNAAIVKLLLASESRDNEKIRDLSLFLRTAIIQSHHEIALMLISHCTAMGQISEIDKGDDFGQTPLMLAAQEQDTKLITTILESGANINAQNNDGYTVLHYALKNKNKNLSKYLIEKGIDPRAGNFNFSSALALARHSGDSLAEKYIRSTMKKGDTY